MAHKLSFACAEMILSYHLLPQLIFFTHKLGSVTSLLGVLCWCLLFVCVGFCFWCFVVLFSVLCCLFSDERDSTLDYVSVLHQFTFAATTASAFA